MNHTETIAIYVRMVFYSVDWWLMIFYRDDFGRFGAQVAGNGENEWERSRPLL